MNLIDLEEKAYKKFSFLIQEFDAFIDSPHFEKFIICALKEEISEWETITTATKIILDKMEIGPPPFENIKTYNYHAGKFYQEVVVHYLFFDSRELLSKFMLKNIL